ncbi:MAG: hypothetical protein KDA41_21020, partial [Planctomycetales bacterium]|nr:hypothetical protein [Planctomycetales bacterium]
SVAFVPTADAAGLRALQSAIAGAEWIVDAMLGTGASGSPRPPYDEVIRRLNDATAKRLALDIPSGLDCDTGHAGDPTFVADHTCTFAAAKPGLLADATAPFVGSLHVVDIGVPKRLLEEVSHLP